MYVTYSEGFRPGGVNRRGTFPPYNADFLKNYEIGWKTSWTNNRLRFNGAMFRQDWEDFQFSYLGAERPHRSQNAGGARVKGIEADLNWAVTGAAALRSRVDRASRSKLTENYCGASTLNGNRRRICAIRWPRGTRCRSPRRSRRTSPRATPSRCRV